MKQRSFPACTTFSSAPKLRPAICVPCRAAAIGLLASLALMPLAGCKGHAVSVASLKHLFHHRKSTSKPNSTDYEATLQQIAATPQLAALKWPDFSLYQQQVQQFYDDRDWELAWTRDGKPTDQATRLIQIFGDAARKGLDPEDYDASRWAHRAEQLNQISKTHDSSDAAGNTIAQFDAAMTITLMRYLSDLHLGRINPQSLNFDIDVPTRRQQFDLATLVNDQVVDADDVTSVLDRVEPQNPIYKATEDALPHFLDLAKQESSQPQTPLPPVSKTIAPGGTYPALAQLAERLAFEGEGQVQVNGDRYTPELAQVVQGFQNRHGLTTDSKLSQSTIDALNVPMSVRVQQINDALERWRWLPDNFVKARVFVNLPEFYVRTYDANGDLAFKMKVVDGQAKGNHDTPMFVRTMRFLIFRPYWNLPPDIVKKDLLKHASVAYFESHGYEVTDRSGQAITNWTVDDLEHSRYLVRQKPGPKNSLGLVKFMFPNEYDIYMHSTPEMNLFNLTRRDRSHGCIRLNDAEKMANWVLNGQGDWDANKIHQAMYGLPLNDGSGDPTQAGGDPPQTGGDVDSGPTSTAPQVKDNKQVNLQTPLPVNISYLTALADEDGTMHFFEDLYGYDKDLEAALSKPRPFESKPVKINPKLTPGETE